MLFLKVKKIILKSKISEGGFSLIELLVAMTIGILVLAAIYSVFRGQKRSYILEERKVSMEQSLRVALDSISRDIKLAGRNPNGITGLIVGSNLGITAATATSLTIVSLAPVLADPPLTVTYALTVDDTPATRDIDGDPTMRLRRGANPMSLQPLAEHFTPASNFQYFNVGGNLMADTSTTALRADIRMVRINLFARTEREDPTFSGGFDKDGDPATGTSPTEEVHVDVMARNLSLQ